jgi:hypothetical protein
MRARRGVVVPVLLLGGVLAVAAGGFAPTSSAWTDGAWFAATDASAGDWSGPAPASVCEVLDAAGQPDPARTCDVTLGEDTDARDDNYNIRMTVSTVEAQDVRWRVRVAFADTAEFPFVASAVGVYNPVTILGPLAPDFCTAGDRTVGFEGIAAQSTDVVGPGRTFVLDFDGVATGPVFGGTTVYDCSATP